MTGVWRTISGRRVFIKDGQSLTEAMRESGKFKLPKKEISFEESVDKLLDGTLYDVSHITVLENTPKVLQELGLEDLPIMITRSKLERVLKKDGGQNREYHDLGPEIVKKIPEAIKNPLDIIESHNDSLVLTTDLSDSMDRTVIIPIKINGKGNYYGIEIDSNIMTSAYGRNNYDSFMNKHLRDGNVVWDVDRGHYKKR